MITRIAGSREADKGTLVVPGDAQAQAMPFAHQGSYRQQVEVDLTHLARHHRLDVLTLEGVSGRWQAARIWLGGYFAVHQAELAFCQVVTCPSG
jgi:hypothetical protein